MTVSPRCWESRCPTPQQPQPRPAAPEETRHPLLLLLLQCREAAPDGVLLLHPPLANTLAGGRAGGLAGGLVYARSSTGLLSRRERISSHSHNCGPQTLPDRLLAM
ncbi:hypothetical protein ACJQWK_07147 [Exserohilum turcicum]